MVVCMRLVFLFSHGKDQCSEGCTTFRGVEGLFGPRCTNCRELITDRLRRWGGPSMAVFITSYSSQPATGPFARTLRHLSIEMDLAKDSASSKSGTSGASLKSKPHTCEWHCTSIILWTVTPYFEANKYADKICCTGLMDVPSLVLLYSRWTAVPSSDIKHWLRPARLMPTNSRRRSARSFRWGSWSRQLVILQSFNEACWTQSNAMSNPWAPSHRQPKRPTKDVRTT